MNNKGFTLIELLAVIIILSMLVAIISISVDNVVKNSRKQLSDTQIENIEKAANAYYLKEGIVNSYNNRSFKMCVNLSYLIENDYIEDDELLNPKNQENLNGSVEITYNDAAYTYKYKENSCNYEYKAINEICKAVTEETKTTGNIPQGNYLPGDEYICEVKNNTEYHFFVLSTEGDNVNLIMDRNVYYDSTNDVGNVATETNKGLIDWYDGDMDNSYGPVTAMTYLHNATKDWDNIPNMIMYYEDENIDEKTGQKGTMGYGSIKTTDNITIIATKSGEETGRIENLKTRMPSYEEVHGQGKCLNYLENNNQHGGCSLWLSNYLEYSEYLMGEGVKNISGIYGYLMLSSWGNSVDGVWRVRYTGDMSFMQTTSYDVVVNGVRPVISIRKLDIAN